MVSADSIASVAFGAVKSGVCQLDELNRIACVAWKFCDAEADRNMMRRRFPVHIRACCGGKGVLLDGGAHAFGGNESLRAICVEQKCGELFAAETRRDIARA